MTTKRVLVTGADGFIGRNLCVALAERGHEVLEFVRGDDIGSISDIDFCFHAAGVNRPKDERAFIDGNSLLTSQLCDHLASLPQPIPLLVTSSMQATLDNPYGQSKLAGEEVVRNYGNSTGRTTYIWRLPGVFGKWSRPDYNSVVATFCVKTLTNQELLIRDPNHTLKLTYIDDVITSMIDVLESATPGEAEYPVYEISLGDLAKKIRAFKESRSSGFIDSVGTGLERALYATYLSFMDPDEFSYPLIVNGDERGNFVEILKTSDSGQFSYFTAHPGVTRGGHYHHTKNEKFLVVSGIARFGFRHIVTDEYCELFVTGEVPQVVETVPGWAHDITNTGDVPLVVLLWANETFDQNRPDTTYHRV